jgi:hypothetical protein
MKVDEEWTPHKFMNPQLVFVNMVLFRLLKARKHPKKFLTTKGIKIQEKIWMKKSNINHGL